MLISILAQGEPAGAVDLRVLLDGAPVAGAQHVAQRHLVPVLTGPATPRHARGRSTVVHRFASEENCTEKQNKNRFVFMVARLASCRVCTHPWPVTTPSPPNDALISPSVHLLESEPTASFMMYSAHAPFIGAIAIEPRMRQPECAAVARRIIHTHAEPPLDLNSWQWGLAVRLAVWQYNSMGGLPTVLRGVPRVEDRVVDTKTNAQRHNLTKYAHRDDDMRT